jgi:anaphase-promoting complex subunit 5
MQNRDRLFYQYALMNLAVLQADFGCLKEAVATMLETVNTARENRDNTCLNFSLNWLFHFGRNYPHLVAELESKSMLGSGKESLGYLRVKAKETGMWTLWISALLTEAKIALSTGDSIASALEFMVRSSQVLVEKNMKNMVGAQITLYVALWDRLGLPNLGATAAEVFIRCHARNAVFDDELKITCRLAGHLAGKGRYDAAMERLESLDANALRAWKSSQYWHKYRGLIKLRREMHRGNIQGADMLLSELVQGKPDDLESELSFIVDSMQVEYLIRRSNLTDAFATVEDLLAKRKDQPADASLNVRLLLMKASLFDRVGRPQRGFSIVMRAASQAWRARLIPLLWQAIGALANILSAMGEFAAATELLLPIIPRCLECESSFMVGQLYSWLADAHMGSAGERGGAERTELMTRASDALEQACKHFALVEDVDRQCEMRAKQATIMKAMGEDKLAENFAAQYLSLKRGDETEVAM